MNQEYYDQDAAEIGTSIVQSQQMGIALVEPYSPGQIATRAHRKMAHRAELDATQEHLKAKLAATIITNTVGLVNFSNVLTAAVPNAEPPVREVVHAYARSSANRLAERW